MMSSGLNSKSPHCLVLPVALWGHIAPLFRLAIQLAQKGVIITFVSYEEDVFRFKSGEASPGRMQGLDFRWVPLKKPEGIHRTVTNIAKRMQEAFQPFLEKLTQDRNVPTCVISDSFLPWTSELAEKLQIPRYVFVASGVILARFVDGMLDHINSFQVSEDGKIAEFDWLVYIPGLPPLRYHELPQPAREEIAIYWRRAEAARQSMGLLVNSIFELEEKVIESWQSAGLTDHVKVPKIYPVGPLFSASLSLPNSTGVEEGVDNPTTQCLHWLGSQPSSSVLYIAFGTLTCLNPEQIKEVAHGLDDSQQRFLWVIPQPEGSSVADLLPAGFHARVGDRGYIMREFAPQVQILAHESTGGFLTHSGWNSTLESIVWGVPMISWPQFAEQHLNCRYLVDDLKIAVELQTGPENIVNRKEVERVVRLLMAESEGKGIKSRVEEFKRKAASAMAEGGSSSKFLLQFLDEIHQSDRLQN